MKTVCDLNKCNGCLACVSKCPKKCIKIIDNIDAMNAEIDESMCINCNLCKKTCPNLSVLECKKPIEWKQGWAKPEIRKNSSSGGIATAIIIEFIKSGGYVASCLYKNGDFIFEITNDIKIAKRFAGSKYVKSNPVDIYQKIQERLKNNKVLFIGLPCQVAGLKKVINIHNNLYTIDLICHGTPSIKILHKYLKEIGYNINDIDEIKFRNKNDYGLIVNGKKVFAPRVMDHYMCSFLASINFTENCYSCKFATTERISDITLGDSWGTNYDEQQKKGVSLVLVQSEKGKELLEKADIELKEVDIKNAIDNNHQLSHPSICSKKRKKFMSYINKKSIKYASFVTMPKVIIKQKIKWFLFRIGIIKE